MLYKVNSKLVISTSRKPTQITRRFSQFLKHYFDAVYINRGKSSFSKVVNQALGVDDSLLLIVTETKGNPSSINVYNPHRDPENPLASIYINVSLKSTNTKINTNPDCVVIINKSKGLSELFSGLESFKSDERIVENCVVIEDFEDNVFKASFFDKKGLDTEYKIYVKGFKVY